jgi:eukaryotic-like serine/threonine-protein kinase
VKLADFGIARAADQSSITQVGSVLGTAAYLSPEQARGEEAGPRADLYSLGVVSYQLLSGRLPYEAASLSELALKQQRESPIPLDELNPSVPHALALAVSMALAIDQHARPNDAMELAEAMTEGAQGIMPAGAAGANFATSPSTQLLDERDDATAATRLTPRPAAPRTTQTRAAQSRTARAAEPRRVPPRRPEPAYNRRAAQPEPRSRGGRGFRRLMVLLALIGVFALVVIAAVAISNSTSNTVVHYKKIVARDANSAISQIQSLINQYTK